MKERHIVMCTYCKDIIESHHRRDFKWCRCRKVAVDGGPDCPRVIFGRDSDYETVKGDYDTRDSGDSDAP